MIEGNPELPENAIDLGHGTFYTKVMREGGHHGFIRDGKWVPA